MRRFKLDPQKVSQREVRATTEAGPDTRGPVRQKTRPDLPDRFTITTSPTRPADPYTQARKRFKAKLTNVHVLDIHGQQNLQRLMIIPTCCSGTLHHIDFRS
eukprot:6314347-Amphidinium_carterae.1